MTSQLSNEHANANLKNKVEDTGLYASNGSRQANASYDMYQGEYTIAYGDVMMPADYRRVLETWEATLDAMLDFAPADEWTDDEEEISPSFDED